VSGGRGTIGELDTPVPLVDVDRLESNLSTMAAITRRHGVAHRPHTKTHKTREIAQRQVAHGAAGITVAKVGEAEVMVEAGFDDIFIAYPLIGEAKYRRLVELMDRARVRFAVDSVAGVERAGAFFAQRGVSAQVLVEFDGGAGRSGTQTADDALEVARAVDANRGLELRGVMSYGNAYATTDLDEQAAIGEREGVDAVAVATVLRSAGLRCDVVSLGSTPTARHAAKVSGVTEIRAGVYAFHDLKQVSLGVATYDDCALTVLATVVSHPRPDRYVLDAGIKTLAGEEYGWGTYGRILGNPDVVLTGATEEHGIVTLPPDVIDPAWSIGDRVRVIPDHACGCANMHDRLMAVQGDDVVDEWSVIGRGKVQ
jgi:D-serine deaminase-like pyridoxal phosphate-dependent protein